MAITTLLAALVAIQWGYSPIIVIAVNGFFIAFLMLTWRSGVRLVERARAKLRQPEEDLIETAVSRCQARLPGTAVYRDGTGVDCHRPSLVRPTGFRLVSRLSIASGY
jgi:KUP system potassium uptake protein